MNQKVATAIARVGKNATGRLPVVASTGKAANSESPPVALADGKPANVVTRGDATHDSVVILAHPCNITTNANGCELSQVVCRVGQWR